MVDPDAPYRDNEYRSFLHWINTNDSVVEFTPSNPPPESKLHRYFIVLLEQEEPINRKQVLSQLEINKEIHRQNFNAKEFRKQYNLTPISYVMYRTENKNPCATRSRSLSKEDI